MLCRIADTSIDPSTKFGYLLPKYLILCFVHVRDKFACFDLPPPLAHDRKVYSLVIRKHVVSRVDINLRGGNTAGSYKESESPKCIQFGFMDRNVLSVIFLLFYILEKSHSALAYPG